MKKAVYHRKANQLLIETDKTHSNGIITFSKVKQKYFLTEKESEAYTKRYLKNHTFSSQEY